MHLYGPSLGRYFYMYMWHADGDRVRCIHQKEGRKEEGSEGVMDEREGARCVR